MRTRAGPVATSDAVLDEIARYAAAPLAPGDEAMATARRALLDALACALLALDQGDCRRVLGPPVPGAATPDGSRVPGTALVLDPVTAAFDIGACIRWLDYNDTWLAREWSHPSDNFAALLALTDHLGRRHRREGGVVPTVADLLVAAVKAYEIQGVLALGASLNAVGVDHVVLVRAASAAICAALLGGSEAQVRDALSQAFLDGGTLRTYRHGANTGSRKSWAAGDASSRGLRLALLTLAGEPGYATPLGAPEWGFEDAVMRGARVVLEQPLASYVMENVLFKVAFPAEFHGQTAVEAALRLHPEVRGRAAEVERVEITTQAPALRIIDKSGPLRNPADRDHCLQYMVAVALLRGEITAQSYADETASDPAIDRLRALTVVREDPRYSAAYLDPDRRAIANAVQVFFAGGGATERVEVLYPLGHRRRREEAVPLLEAKWRDAVERHFPAERAATILEQTGDGGRLAALSVPDLLDLLELPGDPGAAAVSSVQISRQALGVGSAGGGSGPKAAAYAGSGRPCRWWM